ncbi:MAG: energy transducer TonB [Acidobacteria bacterium]|nr:energy transducer TonB [Acidobacteriota bacterium]
MQNKALFADAFISQPSLVARLAMEFAEASREFRENPSQYVSSAVKGDGIGGRRRRMHLMYGAAVALLVFSTLFLGILVAYTITHAKDKIGDELAETSIPLVDPNDFKMQEIDAPKSSAKERAGGGGGGGRKTPTPPSKGQLPEFSLKPPIIAPRPEQTLRPPALPVPETVQVDPRLQPKRDDLTPTGLPTGVLGPPSAGPGEGGGMGTGKNGGMGSGDGTGVGPGRGFNMGGGDPRLGGSDFNADGSAKSVDSKPQALNRPRPNYTEEARKNKIQGVVRARALIGADGSVKQVRVLSSLPDGLNEEAILAVKQMRFKPATKNGQPVPFWQTLEIEFNLR